MSVTRNGILLFLNSLMIPWAIPRCFLYFMFDIELLTTF